MTPEEPGSLLRARAGLCGRCQHARVTTSDRGSQFLRCHWAAVDPAYPKYPRLPVVQCDAFAGRAKEN